MAWGYYLVPTIGSGITVTDPRRAKYVNQADTPGLVTRALHYGLEPVTLLAADLEPAQHDFVAKQADVVALPQMDEKVAADSLVSLKAALDDLKLPSDWLADSHTGYDVVRALGQMIQVMQSLSGLTKQPFFKDGVTPKSPFGDLAAVDRAAVEESVARLSALVNAPLDTSEVKGAIPMEQVLHDIGQQLPAFYFGETF